MPIRPPRDDLEANAMIRAQAFVDDLREAFVRHNMDMLSLIALTPEGLILTLGDATDIARRAGIEAIEIGKPN